MADLSAVLRKTIDGLPNASPQLRAKVYEKARAAIARQIDTANPPLPEEVIEARRSALEDAIDRTEDHYLDQDLAMAGIGEEPDVAPARPAPQKAAPAMPQSPGPSPAPAPSPPRPDTQAVLRQPVQKPALPSVSNGPSSAAPVQKPAWPKVSPAGTSAPTAARADARRDPSASERTAPTVFPMGVDARPADSGPLSGKPAARPTDRREPGLDAFSPPLAGRETEPSTGLDTSAIPAADLAAPRYGNGRRRSEPRRSRAPVLASLAVLVLAAGGALAYVYQDEVQALIGGSATTTAATAPTDAGVDAARPSGSGTATPAATPPASDVAALAPGVEAPASSGPAAPVATGPASNRRFTQRLLPDGSEIDEGPGAGNANAFEEGTNIAAASPETLAPAVTPAPDVPATASPSSTPNAPPEQASIPSETTVPATPPASTPPGSTTTAALQPDTVTGVPAVAQKAVFYEERSETEQGTQRGGNVVWSVVNEPPSDGQAPEPAIRAVADVPEENLRMTMTIRRNADATLPASHVIELMFDVPADFAGGQIANVQRLALKPTEESRGEPLIGVAGKISDGFFIIALNNLAQATQTNLDLMSREQWIDIPLAYATGRRALMSIEKGIPGDRVFKQAMDAWAAKT